MHHLREAAPRRLRSRDLAEHPRRREDARVAAVELAEVVVPGELAAAESAGPAQCWLREGMADRHHHRLEAVLAQRLGRAAARAHVVDDFVRGLSV